MMMNQTVDVRCKRVLEIIELPSAQSFKMLNACHHPKMEFTRSCLKIVRSALLPRRGLLKRKHI